MVHNSPQAMEADSRGLDVPAFTSAGIIDIAKKTRTTLRVLRRGVAGADRRIIRRYLSRHGAKKLHVSCGDNGLEGWLNTEYFPTARGLVHLDATGPFPFPDGAFDFVFSEHMIEHVPYAGGQNMLRECHRVLREDGVLRVSTPDLAFLVDLYRSDKSELQRAYVDWNTKCFLPHAPHSEDTFVINNYFRCWGHSFIYDEKVMRHSLERAGFDDLETCELHASRHEALRSLEHEHRLPAGFLRLESLIMEGTKR